MKDYDDELPFYFGFSGGCILAAVCIVGYQLITFMRTGVWPPISVATALAFLGSEWATYPTSWIGIHRILNWLPLSGTLFFAGAGVFIYFDEREKA